MAIDLSQIKKVASELQTQGLNVENTNSTTSYPATSDPIASFEINKYYRTMGMDGKTILKFYNNPTGEDRPDSDTDLSKQEQRWMRALTPALQRIRKNKPLSHSDSKDSNMAVSPSHEITQAGQIGISIPSAAAVDVSHNENLSPDSQNSNTGKDNIKSQDL